jgi:hypothetical protein
MEESDVLTTIHGGGSQFGKQLVDNHLTIKLGGQNIPASYDL